MFLFFNNSLSIKCIKNILKIRNIKYIYSFNKPILLKILNRDTSCRIIQKNFRKLVKTYTECPISHEKLKYPFACFKINNKFLYYDFDTIVEYFNKTRNFRDPLTRVEINDVQINKLNELIRYYYGRRTNKIIITDKMAKNTELNIVTYCLYDLANEINAHNELSINDIYNSFLPRLIYYIHILSNNHDLNCVSIILNSFIHHINTDIKNVYIIYDYVLLRV